MDGILTKKGGQVGEGIACFYNKLRLKYVYFIYNYIYLFILIIIIYFVCRLLSNHSLILGEESCNEVCLKNIWSAVSTNESLCMKLKERTTAVQVK